MHLLAGKLADHCLQILIANIFEKFQISKLDYLETYVVKKSIQ